MPARSRRTRAELEQIARTRFGYDALRPGQRQVIEAVLAGQDTLAVMPTGSGKSAIYQIAGLLLDGPTVVVSPLIALQQDQLESIQDKDLPQAAAVNSAQAVSERREALEDAEDGEVEFLFLAPEQFANDGTRDRLLGLEPSLVVVDEAHCISEWGHDFRPDYRRLGGIVDALGHPVVLALTATAAPRVRADIVDGLGMRRPRVIVTGFNRPNIWLGVRAFETGPAKLAALLKAVREAPKAGIVYVATRRRAEEVAEALRADGVRGVAYHAGLRPGDRERIQLEFMRDEHEVIVATNAFGMGVDKPNVRFVYHLDVPDSVDAYYQEIGRAGRDGEPARAVLFYRRQDAGMRRAMVSTGKILAADFQRVLEALRRDGAVAPAALSQQTEIAPRRLTKILHDLERAGAAEILATGEVLPRNGETGAETLAGRAAEEREGFRRYRVGRVELMQAYAETPGCRRRYILNYFGEALEEDCENCDRCEAGASVRHVRSGNPAFQLHARVRHPTFGEGTVMRREGDSLVILFDRAGTRKLALEHLRAHDLLTLAGG